MNSASILGFPVNAHLSFPKTDLVFLFWFLFGPLGCRIISCPPSDYKTDKMIHILANVMSDK